MKKWMETARVYSDPRILSIFLLGFASGMPFFLTLATLHARMSEAGISKTLIGFFVLLTLPYSLKFIWAPIIDTLKLPVLNDLLGHRKSWMISSQLLLVIALFNLGTSDPVTNIIGVAVWTLVVSFLSATQDIVVEAYRVEILQRNQIGAGATASNLGYRLGLWVSGAGALYLAAHFSWEVAYAFMAATVAIGIVTTLLSPEPLGLDQASPAIKKLKPHNSLKQHFIAEAYTLFRHALRSLYRERNWATIVLFILFYKLSDTMLNIMSIPFLLEIGFSKLEIAHVAKSFGIGAMIFGGIIGGLMIARYPILHALILCSALQIFASLMFMTQASLGKNLPMLFITIGIENLACGLGSAAFVTYLSYLCQRPFTASQFALLTSLGSLSRLVFSGAYGWLADQLSWFTFYASGTVLCIPFLALLILKSHDFTEHSKSPNTFKAAHS
ncbi:MAG: AmpG family muropeptide MFS transporter [Candidatus Nucleicultricaceae bacterium]|jgi:PAT family beta-lactamase induction signal transducer AmpG